MNNGKKTKPAEAAPKRAGGQRVDQGKIDQMVALRRQGIGYEQIGARVGCSVRTVQRYVKNVRSHSCKSRKQANSRNATRVWLRQQILSGNPWTNSSEIINSLAWT